MIKLLKIALTQPRHIGNLEPLLCKPLNSGYLVSFLRIKEYNV